ncbi:MAG: type II toxin-antitoxin system HicB family antitoxin [Crocosphaera sp.]
MQDNLIYKGYQGHIEIDLDSGIFFGRVLNIKDVITFQGETIEKAYQAFYDSIDDYLEFCGKNSKISDIKYT